MHYYKSDDGRGVSAYDDIANANADHTGETEISEEEYSKMMKERRHDSDY